MIHLPQDSKEFLWCLNNHEVEYLLIGGYAVGYHGYPRATGDIDVWVGSRPISSAAMISRPTSKQPAGSSTLQIWRTLVDAELFVNVRADPQKGPGVRGLQLMSTQGHLAA
jgi:hypothetical protein